MKRGKLYDIFCHVAILARGSLGGNSEHTRLKLPHKRYIRLVLRQTDRLVLAVGVDTVDFGHTGLQRMHKGGVALPW